jgi:hypothetical protein
MSTGDLDDLAALWRADPDPGEREELEQLARQARRRGRLVDFVDLAMLALLVGGSIVAAFAIQNPLLLVAGAIVIVATAWLTLKRRKIRQMARSLNTADRRGFLESSIGNVKANLRSNLLSLIVFPLFAPVVVLLKVGARTGGDPGAMIVGLIEWASSQRGLITLAVGFLLMAFVYRARRRHRSELRRLLDVRSAYEDEARQDAVKL